MLAGMADKYMQFDTSSDIPLTWCEGCGDYAIQNALKRALALEGMSRTDVLFCFDVGCSGNGSDKIEGYTIHGLHGRVLPLAAGCKLGNEKMTVIASAGDGATFSEGVGHVLHAIRNDYPIVFLHHDNNAYALTTGQASSRTPQGCHMNASPEGINQEPLNHLDMVLSLKPSFLARTSSVYLDHMTDIFRQAIRHKGFAFVDILQTCPTYNRHMQRDWYMKNIKTIESKFPDYDETNWMEAHNLIASKDPIYIGKIFGCEKENFLESVKHRKRKTTSLVEEVERVDISPLLEKL